ncbi:MAG: hypothetical protein ACHP7K_12105 [Actinomycetales bacterium]
MNRLLAQLPADVTSFIPTLIAIVIILAIGGVVAELMARASTTALPRAGFAFESGAVPELMTARIGMFGRAETFIPLAAGLAAWTTDPREGGEQ